MRKSASIPFLIAVILLAGCGESSQEEAETVCREDTLNRAKYPGGAEIVSANIEEGDDGKIHVTGLADFPNGFGTPNRWSYFCTAIEGEVTDNVVMEGDWINLD